MSVLKHHKRFGEVFFSQKRQTASCCSQNESKIIWCQGLGREWSENFISYKKLGVDNLAFIRLLYGKAGG